METMRIRCFLWAGALLLSVSAAGWAQEADALQAVTPSLTTAAAANEDAPAAKIEDVNSIDAIVKAFYDTVSAPAGTPRQWDRDRSLYVPGARLVAIGVPTGATAPKAKVMDHQQYQDDSDGAMVRDGFYEKETHRVVRRFGSIAQVFSTYELRTTVDGPVKERGVNSLDLFYDGTRWWIASALWDTERTDNPIPDSLQPWGLGCPPPAGKKGGKRRRR
jgi:hypothetical protein